MAWIKKNLIFVVFSAVALVLLIVASWVLFSNMGRDAAVQEELNQKVSDWQRLNTSGSFPNQENIEIAKREQEKLRKFRKEVASVIPVASAPPKLSDQAFASMLGTSIAEMRNKAAATGVILPQQFDFTFAAQRKSLNFPAGSIENWIPQLTDIKSITDVLFMARVNALDSIKRVPVSPQDSGEADFLAATIVSNQFGVFTPYQVSFRGFTPELASVLEAMQRTTNFIVIKSVTIGPAGTSSHTDGGYSELLGLPESGPRRRYPIPGTTTQSRTRTRQPGAVAETVISEQPLQVTLLLDVVKLNPAQ